MVNGNTFESDSLEDREVDGNMILRCILKEKEISTVFRSCHKITGQNICVKVASKSSEDVAN
jgi:hypothetical protein